MRRALVFAVLIVLAGCASPLDAGSREEPGDDELGWENGYWYDDPVDVTTDDGFNESEREAIVSRAMARIEEIRGLEFEETVPVEVISREEYRNRSGGGGSSGAYNDWNNQVWEGLFLVGEETDVSDSFDSTLGASVTGYYSPGNDEIVIVSDSETPTIDRGTLVHELVHALQDQQFGLNASADTQDRQLATDGVIEGEANYLEGAYQQRCGNGWDCVETPERSGGDAPADYNRGLFLTIYQPYATGPDFVDAVRERDGWAGVDALHDDFPASTEQVIHPEAYPDERPVNVTVRDRSNDEWERFDVDPVADTVGEASVFAMFLQNGAVDVSGPAVYDYESAPSEGWGGDSLVPYENGDGVGAYVWVTRWDTREDARQFRAAYERVLDAHDAEARGDGVYVIPESDPFGDAIRIDREGTRVRIVNAPTVADLDAVHDAPE